MRSRAAWILLLLLGVLLAAGIARLFFFRFEQGDIYPPYSTLRADPLGCRVLHDSLAELPGLDVTRHHDTLEQLVAQPAPALLLAGTDLYGWAIRYSDNSDALRGLLAAGGRVVVAMRPQGASRFTNDVERLEYDVREDDDVPPPWPFNRRSPGDPSDRGGTNAVVATNAPAADGGTNAVARRAARRPRGDTNFVSCVNGSCARFVSWGFEVGVDWSNRLDRLEPVALRTTAAPAWLPPTIPCHTHASFTNLAPAWRVLYERDGQPVMIERSLNGGTIVILADAYALSNEAMRKDRRAGLAAWLVGDRTRIVFDESHHGIAISASFGDLARKYGLIGLFLGLIVLFGAYVWMSALPLLPRAPESNVADTRVSGRDSAAGLINLLRRNIPEKRLIDECVAAWEATHPEATPDRRAAIRRILAAQPDPVAAANAIAQLLRPQSGRPRPAGPRHETDILNGKEPAP